MIFKGVNMDIRTTMRQDDKEISRLLHDAFSSTEHGYDGEAELVNRIRCDPTFKQNLEVVGVENEQVVGYGLLSEIVVVDNQSATIGVCLAPLAVLPLFQRRGIGAKLMAELEQRARQLGYQFISILGWPDYYTRFGYVPASLFQISAPIDVPNEAYLIKSIGSDDLQGVRGTVKYLAAFGI